MDILYEIKKLARQLCCYRANPLQYFDEAAGATLVKKGGLGTTPQLVLTDDSTYLGDSTGSATGYHSAVGGGEGNLASDAYATIGGGITNVASQAHTTIGGGEGNTASGDNATVAGGQINTASGDTSTVAGGNSNAATGQYASSLGGVENGAGGIGSTTVGGAENLAGGDYSVAVGLQAQARFYGEMAQSAGTLGYPGVAQHSRIQARGVTTDNTATVLTLDGVAAAGGMGVKITPDTGEVWGIRVRVVAVSAGISKAIIKDLEFGVTNFGGTLAQMGTTDIGFDKNTGAPAWTVVPYIANDTISVEVTGTSGQTVKWFADFWCSILTG